MEGRRRNLGPVLLSTLVTTTSTIQSGNHPPCPPKARVTRSSSYPIPTVTPSSSPQRSGPTPSRCVSTSHLGAAINLRPALFARFPFFLPSTVTDLLQPPPVGPSPSPLSFQTRTLTAGPKRSAGRRLYQRRRRTFPSGLAVIAAASSVRAPRTTAQAQGEGATTLCEWTCARCTSMSLPPHQERVDGRR